MTAMNRAALWERLCAAGVAHGEMPATTAAPTPWYVRLMLGVAGWIGAWFFLGFLGTAFLLIFQHGIATIAAGAACCAGSYVVFRAARDNDFVSQFGLAVSLAGQILVIAGLFNVLGDSFSATLCLLIAVFEVLLVILIANFVHRVWCTIGAAVALSLALVDAGAHSIHGLATGLSATAFAGLWLNEQRWVVRSVLWRPIGYGVAIALLWFEGFLLVERATPTGDGMTVVTILASWIGPALTGAVLVYAVFRLLSRHNVSASSAIGISALVTTGAVAILTIGAPGVAAALLLLILGFEGGHRVLFGMGVIALLSSVTYFYYSLHATLLMKSGVLVATGLVLIVAWAATRRLIGDADRTDVHA